MTLTNNRAALLCCFSCVRHFVTTSEFKLELQSGNAPIWVKIDLFCPLCPQILTDDLEKQKGAFCMLLQALCIIFWAIVEFKLELQSRNAQFGSNRCFFSSVTLKFDRCPWKTIGHLLYATSRFVYHFVAIGEFKLDLQSGNAQFRSKSTIFLAVWLWKLTDDLETQKGTSPKHHQAFCIISSSYGNSKWSYSLETANFFIYFCDLALWPLTSTFAWTSRLSFGNNS